MSYVCCLTTYLLRITTYLLSPLMTTGATAESISLTVTHVYIALYRLMCISL